MSPPIPDPIFAELDQMHEYVRHILTVYVAWFSFFLVLLFGAMGWATRASLDRKGRFSYPSPFVAVLILFNIQLVFGVMATRAIRGDFERFDERTRLLSRTVGDASSETSSGYKSPFPGSIHFSMSLMQWTLLSNLIFWNVLGALLYATRRHRIVGSPDVSDQ
ncbi:MAG: hypothetical protein HC882_02375 [Acidobacteria bacterium]|nr:hypothetical protein [Acidobacteriota bacterium]